MTVNEILDRVREFLQELGLSPEKIDRIIELVRELVSGELPVEAFVDALINLGISPVEVFQIVKEVLQLLP